MNQREVLTQALREELAHVGYGRGSLDQQRTDAIRKAAQRAQLDYRQTLRLVTGGDVFGDGQRIAEGANFAATNRIVKAETTNAGDLARRMAARANEEARDVGAEIAKAQGIAENTATTPTTSSNWGVFGDVLRQLLRGGPSAPVNSPARLAPAVNASVNPARQAVPVSKSAPAMVNISKSVVALRKAAVDELRLSIALAHVSVTSPEGTAKVAEMERQLNDLVRGRGVR